MAYKYEIGKFECPVEFQPVAPTNELCRQDLENDDVELWLVQTPWEVQPPLLHGQSVPINKTSVLRNLKIEDEAQTLELSSYRCLPDELKKFSLLVPDEATESFKRVPVPFKGHLVMKKTFDIPDIDWKCNKSYVSPSTSFSNSEIYNATSSQVSSESEIYNATSSQVLSESEKTDQLLNSSSKKKRDKTRKKSNISHLHSTEKTQRTEEQEIEKITDNYSKYFGNEKKKKEKHVSNQHDKLIYNFQLDSFDSEATGSFENITNVEKKKMKHLDKSVYENEYESFNADATQSIFSNKTARKRKVSINNTYKTLNDSLSESEQFDTTQLYRSKESLNSRDFDNSPLKLPSKSKKSNTKKNGKDSLKKLKEGKRKSSKKEKHKSSKKEKHKSSKEKISKEILTDKLTFEKSGKEKKKQKEKNKDGDKKKNSVKHSSKHEVNAKFNLDLNVIIKKEKMSHSENDSDNLVTSQKFKKKKENTCHDVHENKLTQVKSNKKKMRKKETGQVKGKEQNTVKAQYLQDTCTSITDKNISKHKSHNNRKNELRDINANEIEDPSRYSEFNLSNVIIKKENLSESENELTNFSDTSQKFKNKKKTQLGETNKFSKVKSNKKKVIDNGVKGECCNSELQQSQKKAKNKGSKSRNLSDSDQNVMNILNPSEIKTETDSDETNSEFTLCSNAKNIKKESLSQSENETQFETSKFSKVKSRKRKRKHSSETEYELNNLEMQYSVKKCRKKSIKIKKEPK